MRLRGLPSDEDWGDEARDDETAKRDALIEEMRRWVIAFAFLIQDRSSGWVGLGGNTVFD
jgi:hypothetical protein